MIKLCLCDILCVSLCTLYIAHEIAELLSGYTCVGFLSLVFMYCNSLLIYCLGSLKEKMISETQSIFSIGDHRQYDHKDIANELQYMKTRLKLHDYVNMSVNIAFMV